MTFSSLLKIGALSIAVPCGIYMGILGLLALSTTLQTHVFYLHRVSLTSKDLRVPEMFGFLPRQVAPLNIATADGEQLHAWHVLPLGLYQRHQAALLAQTAGHLDLLRDDPEARLVVYLHGTSGTIGSGWRPDSYRALSAASPTRIHVLAIDYRGYGLSSGTPSEAGLLEDATAAVNWAMNVAGIPASRIVIFGQSLGTAVGISLSHRFATQFSPVNFAGLVLVASFTDVATLTGTYKIGGVIPVLSPLKAIPQLFSYFTGFLQSTWLSKDRISSLVKRGEIGDGRYHITMIHAEDDTDIPCAHTHELYWRAVKASIPMGISYEDVEHEKDSIKTDLGPGGFSVTRQTERGTISKVILKYGSHDKLMAYPVASLAVLQAFQASDAGFEA